MIVIRELSIEYDSIFKKYPDLLLDFVLLEVSEKYLGERTHKEAIKRVFKIFNEREGVANRINMQYTFQEEKLICYNCTSEEFFSKENKRFTKVSKTMTSIEESKMNYWDAFSYQPYPTEYNKNDFDKLNHMLFPLQFRLV